MTSTNAGAVTTRSPHIPAPDDVDKAREVTRHFVRDYLEEVEAELDRIPDPRDAYGSPAFTEALHKAAELGLTSAAIPTEFGGSGWSTTAQMVMVEELAKGAPGLSSHIMSCGMAASVIISSRAYESNTTYHQYLTGVSGKERAATGAAWAATEPNVGSDIFALDTPNVRYSTRAEVSDNGYILNGEKSTYISNGYCADFFVVMATLGDGTDMSSAGVFLVPGNTPGVSRGRPLDKLGMRALNQASVHFNQVELPHEALAFAPGPKYQRFLERLTARGNIAVGLQSIGLAQRAYDIALDHVKRRQQSGRRLIDHQLVADKMFTAYRRIEAARAFSYRAVAEIENRQMNILNCYASRVQASTMAVQVVEQMTQAMGGAGISKSHPLERYYRDVKLMTIADGTVERIAMSASRRL